MFLYFSYSCDCGHIIIKQGTGTFQLTYPMNAVDLFLSHYWDKTHRLVFSASSPFCSNILFNNAERDTVGVFTVKLRGPTVVPPQTESWFPVLKIECIFL